jgi:hypothetical protein
MLKKVGFGAAFALSVAALAIGCGDDKTTIVQGGNGELNNNENFPASSIASNNVSDDGGGFSGNNQNAVVSNTRLQIKFNADSPASENSGASSGNSTADGSALVFFFTNVHQRVHASHFNGQTFTRPQELTGVDRNDNISGNPQDDRGTHIESACLMPLNTSGYTSPGGQQSADALVRANAGNWLIVWDAQTFSQATSLVIFDTSGNSLAAADANGAHHTLYATMFLASLRNQPSAVSSLVGNTSTTGTPNGTPQEFRFGFQVRGAEIPNNRGGASAGFFGAPINATILDSGTGAAYRPAEDVISYGLSSDTLVGEARYGTRIVGSGNTDPTGLNSGSAVLGNMGGGFITGPTRALAGSGGGTTGTIYAVPGANSYQVGDDTTFVHLFFTQLVTSHGTGNSTVLTNTGNTNAAISLGAAYEFKHANFNLASMTFNTPATVPFPVTGTRSVGSQVGVARMSIQPLGDFRVYNNTVFWRYSDASISNTRNNTFGEEANLTSNLRPNDVTTSVAVLTVTPGTSGTAAINNTNQFDVTFRGTGNTHLQTNSTDPNITLTNGTGGLHIGNEFTRFLDCGGQGIFGTDEGLTDTTAFLLGRTSTNLGTNGQDEDQQLWAIGVNTNGTKVAAGAGANPVRVSAHQTELGVATGSLSTAGAQEPNIIAGLSSITTLAASNSANRDDVFDVKPTMSRDGTYIVVAFRQSQAASVTANLGLMAQVYKTSRNVAVVGSGTGSTATNFDVRFPTTAPIQVNTPSLTVYAQNPDRSNNTINFSDGFTGIPVAAYNFQGALGYRCSFQSDRTRMSLLWLNADDTLDRIFIRQVVVGTGAAATDRPTIAVPAAEAELDGAATGQGARVLAGGRDTGMGTFLDRFSTGNLPQKVAGSSYTFLVGSHGVGTASAFGANAGTGGIAAPTNGPSGFGPVTNQRCSSLNDGTDRVLSHDAGVNAAGAGGEVLIMFSKVVDGTTTDGDFFDRKVFLSRFTATGITERVVISRNIDENNPATNFDDQALAMVGTPKSASLSTPNLSPTNGVNLYMSCPFGDNASSQTSLFTRNVALEGTTVTGQAAPTLANRCTPVAGAATTDATYVNPTRLDRDLNANAVLQDIFTKGTSVIVIIEQDEHLWGSMTSDGKSYSSEGGLPKPPLIDNNLSSSNEPAAVPGSGTSGGVNYGSAHRTDSNCDDTSGSIIIFDKEDVDNTPRYFVRVLQ